MRAEIEALLTDEQKQSLEDMQAGMKQKMEEMRQAAHDAIPCEDKGLERTIWGKTFQVVPCVDCGAPTVTREQAAWIEKSKGIAAEEQFVCDRCKAARTAASVRKLAW